jgi:Flp pilus assembly protein TadD
MITDHQHDKKKAFELHEEGWYQDSLTLCTALLSREKDPSLEVLAATNLFFLKRFGDAELYFRDLCHKMPDSSYLHSYLGKVLEAQGDEGARREYASAVRLDPTNQDALRSYTQYLLKTNDFRGAVPVLRTLFELSKKKEDASSFIKALVRAGRPEEAIQVHFAVFGQNLPTPDLIDALLAVGSVKDSLDAAASLLKNGPDPVVRHRFLRALSLINPAAAGDEFAISLHDSPDIRILSEYVQFLVAQGRFSDALVHCRTLIGRERSPRYRLMECEILDRAGEKEKALRQYETLLREELDTKNDLEVLGAIIGRFLAFLRARYSEQMVKERLIAPIASDVNVVSLLAVAHYLEETGEKDGARSHYYRAFRCDFFQGGIEYARFLSRMMENRECEKVMLYVIANVKRTADLEQIGRVVADDPGQMPRLKRLLSGLITALELRREVLSFKGSEYLAALYYLSAQNALVGSDPIFCKEFCLRGIDALPSGSSRIQLDNFLFLIRASKERSAIDFSVFHPSARVQARVSAPSPTEIAREQDALDEDLGLDKREREILAFLRAHRQASELELRKILGTRRVVGAMNRLIRKASEKGLLLIEKKGVGEQGEEYAYVGR